MTSTNMTSLNQQANSHTLVRQSLINQPPEQQHQPIPIQLIINPPIIHPPIQHNLLLNIPITETHFPLVPISKYKWPLELWMLLGCGIEMVWLGYCWFHVCWIVWYVGVGFWRHNTMRRKVRFWGELVNLLLWLVSYVYVFSGRNDFMFPIFVIFENLDYFFIGAKVIQVYFSFFSYYLRQSYADLRLYIIRKKLQEAKNIIIENHLKKFVDNETKHSTTELKELSVTTQQSVDSNMTKDEFPNKEHDLNNNIEQNVCLICLSHLDIHQGIKHHQTVRLYCNHRYHYGCVKEWIRSGQFKCPACGRYLVD